MLAQLVRLSLQARQHAEHLTDLAQFTPQPREWRRYCHVHFTDGEAEAEWHAQVLSTIQLPG